MNKQSIVHTYSLKALFVVSLGVLPGCWPVSEKETAKEVVREEKKSTTVKNKTVAEQQLTGDVIVTMNGVPIVTSDSLEDEKNKLMEANPQFKMMLAMMDPKQFDRNLAEGLTNQAIVDEYIKQNGVDKTAQYQKDLQEGYKAVERMTNTKFFSQGSVAKVSDADAKSFYDKNKEIMPDLLVSHGGVHAVGVSFNDKAAADEFLKAVGTSSDLQKVATDKGLQGAFVDFKLVNDQSIGVPEKVKSEIASSTQVPMTKVIAGDDNTYWVVHMSEKQEAQYIPFEQIKSEIKAYLEKEKQAEMFEEEVKKLKKKYNITVNEDYFASGDIERDNMMQSMLSYADELADDFDEALA